MKKANTIYSESVDGSVHREESEIIAKLVKYLSPEIVWELGGNLGETSNNIAENLPENGFLYTIDLPEGKLPTNVLSVDDKRYVLNKKPGSLLQDKYKNKVFQLFDDINRFDFSRWEGRVSIVFIDSAHDAFSVERDTNIALKLAAPGALLLWHDAFSTNWPDVTSFLNREFLGKPGFHHYFNTTLAGFWI